MPTKKQMKTASRDIADVISRNYIEGDGDMCSCWFQPEGGGRVGMTLFQKVPVGTPEPFTDLPNRAKVELLVTYVDWKGFSDAQERSVIQRILNGDSPEFWMDGIRAEGSARSQKALFAEWQADYAAAQARDRGEPDGAPTPSISTVKARLEKALFGDKRPEVKQEAKTKAKPHEKEKEGLER